MDPIEREFAFLATAAEDRIAALRAAPALSARPERRRGRSIATHLHAALDGIAFAIEYRRRRFASAVSDVQRLAEIRELRVQNRLLNGIEEMRPWLQADRHAARVYPGVISLLDDACSAMVLTPADVICYPTTAYAYSSATAPLRDYLIELERPEPAGPIPIVLNYPRQEARGLFFHILLLHELGHSADVVHDLYGQVVATDTEAVDEALQEAAERVNSASPTATRVTLEQIQKLRADWLLEVICDAIALGYAGPGYLLGFAAFLLRFKDDLPTTKHPSTQLRLRFLLEQAEEVGWTELMNKRMPLVAEWLLSMATRERTPVPRPFSDLEAVLEMSKAGIWKIVNAHLGECRCVPSAHEREIQRVQNLLPLRILPVEDEDDEHNEENLIDLRAIFTGGWLASAAPEALDPETLIRATKNLRLQAFLSKAMEMSALKRTWDQLDYPEDDD